MGIPGLLSALSSITQNVHVSAYKDKRVAIDTYCWLHKAAYSCSQELVTRRPTKRWQLFSFLHFSLHDVPLFLSFSLLRLFPFSALCVCVGGSECGEWGSGALLCVRRKVHVSVSMWYVLSSLFYPFSLQFKVDFFPVGFSTTAVLESTCFAITTSLLYLCLMVAICPQKLTRKRKGEGT